MTCTRFFRAEKGTPNANAVRVLIPGIAMALALLLGPGVIMTAWDTVFRHRPWLTNQLAVVDTELLDGEPLIHDVTTLRYAVYGVRNVWAENDRGVRLCGAARNDSWDKPSERTWSWGGFFDSRCALPKRPFRVCSGYHLYSPRGVESTAGPFCSEFAAPIVPKEDDA